MKEKYFEDLGLDDGIDILEKFNIDINKIIDKKEENQKKEEKMKVINRKNVPIIR